MSRETLERGRSCMGGFSRAQFDLLGIDTRPPADSPINMNRIPKRWWLMVIGRDYPDEVIEAFVELKDKHLTPNKIKWQITQKIKIEQKKAAYRKARAIEMERLRTNPLPDGVYDVVRRNRREIWEFGKIIKWYLRRNVGNWGAHPDAPTEESNA